MFVSLNESKGSFCSIGEVHFSFVDPGPKELDLGLMDRDELNQLLYNIRKGTLKTKDKKDIKELVNLTRGLPASSNQFVTPSEAPLKDDVPPEISLDPIQEKREEEEKELKKILRGKVEQIKVSAQELDARQLRRMVEFEFSGKKRQSVIKFLEQLISIHQQSVQAQVGKTPLEASKNQGELVKNLSRVDLDNISEVVESDVEQVVLNPYPDDDED
jgi:hypothetical protein